VPEELRARLQENRGEAGLRGHLRNNATEGNEERPASAVYVPREQKDDVQIGRALDLLRGTATDPAFPPSQRAAAAPAPGAAPAPATPPVATPAAPATPAPSR
jgi:carboxyl-terminal processing protease